MTNIPETKTMTTKKKAPPIKKTLLAKQDTKADSEHYAKVSVSAAAMSAALSDSFTAPLFPDLNMIEVIKVLNDKIASVQAGDMTTIEAMLIGQAQALQTMFVSLGRQAVVKTGLQQYTAFMNLALKAQAQSRATIQALIELKYPKQATFVKQANIAGGHQQINNGQASNETNTRAPAHARESTNQPNELLEVNNGSETLDGRTTQKTIPKDKAMATLAT